MGIIPPDPGAVVRDPSRAISLAKLAEHDKLSGGFRLGHELRWLRRDGDRLVASATPEIRVAEATHEALSLASAGPAGAEAGVFASAVGGERGWFVLAEDGFEARVFPA